MDKYMNRREFLRNASLAVTGLGVLATNAEGSTEKTMSQKIEESKQHYSRKMNGTGTGCCSKGILFAIAPYFILYRNKQ